MAKKKVLLIGIDPRLIDPNLFTATGWDANRVRAAQDANKRLVELGYELQTCLLDPRGLMKALSQTHFQGKNLTASWLVLALGYCRRIPFYLRK